MKILLTGSHFTPAQAVFEELKKNPDIKLVYVGRKYTMEGDRSPSVESQALPKLGVKFIHLISGRLQRSLTFYTPLSLVKVPVGFIQAFYFLLKESPDVVLSFGGYVSVPLVLAAWWLSVPIITHEQTLVSGLANTINSWFADKIAVSFPGHSLANSGKTILTGNPMRQQVINGQTKFENEDLRKVVSLAKENRLPLILITGGSQGSHVINLGVLGVLKELVEIGFIVHQTGDSKFRDYESLIKIQEVLQKPERYVAKKWIGGSDWGALLQAADLVISRAGANILLELAALGKPALVIPLPYLYKNEQMVNARYFESLGLVRVLPQNYLTAKNLLGAIKEMLQDLPKLKEKAKEAKSVVIPDAAKRLVLETLLLAREKI